MIVICWTLLRNRVELVAEPFAGISGSKLLRKRETEIEKYHLELSVSLSSSSILI